MGWMGCDRCEKLQHDFVARTIALITPVQYVLQQVSCSYETIPNALKYYETDQNISLGSNGWIRCVRCKKIKCDFVGRTFVLIAPVQYVLHQLSCTYETIPKAPKNYELHRNISLASHCVHWVRLLKKIQTWHRGTNFSFNVYSMFCNKFHAVTKRSQMHPNTTKHTETLL